MCRGVTQPQETATSWADPFSPWRGWLFSQLGYPSAQSPCAGTPAPGPFTENALSLTLQKSPVTNQTLCLVHSDILTNPHCHTAVVVTQRSLPAAKNQLDVLHTTSCEPLLPTHLDPCHSFIGANQIFHGGRRHGSLG